MTAPTVVAPSTAKPAPRPAVRGGPGSEPEAITPARLLGWLRMYWLTILFCGTLVGGGLAWLAWELLPAKYESYALLRVASTPFTVTNQKDPTRNRAEFNTYLKTNAKLIRNEFVLNKALNMEVDGRRISELPTMKAQANPILFLEEELVVTHTDGVEIITLSMKGENPEDVRRIVNAVQMAYMEEVIEKEILERQAFLHTVESTLVRLQQDLARMVGKPAEAPPVQLTAGSTPAALPGGVIEAAAANGPPEWVKRELAQNLVRKAAQLRESVAELPLAINSQKQRLEWLEKQMNLLKSGPPARETIEEVEQDPDVQAVAQREQAYRGKYQRELALYANPNAESVRATLALAEEAAAELKKLKEKKIYDRETIKRQARANELALYIDEATRRLRDLEDKLRADTVRLAEAEREIAKLPPEPVREEIKPEEKPLVNTDATMILAQDDIFRDMAHHAAALRMDIGSPKRVSVLQTASMPVQKDRKKQILATVLAGLLGYGLVGLGLVSYEARVRKISTLQDVADASPAPVAGVIPWQPGSPRCRPEVQDAVEKLRAYVSQRWLARGAATVAVTSTMGNEGREFTAQSLALGLCAAGHKTLLVDFDLREPRLHAELGTTNPAGVCELLRGESDCRTAIQKLPGGLHFLPAGVCNETARAAAAGGRLESLLARLKEPYDCVVLSARPLLNSAETVELARRCEAVLVCARYRETRSPLLKRAMERLTVLEVPFTGVVYLGATLEEALC